MEDKALDSIAVRFSRKFDPGYEEKREREIRELQEERRIRLRIEKEIEDKLQESTFIDADPEEDDIDAAILYYGDKETEESEDEE